MSNEAIPKLCCEDDLLNRSSDEEGWMELDDQDEDDNDESTLCLFCSHESKSVALAMVHVKNDHGVDFHELKRKFNMDQYSFIKMINYIRMNKVESDVIAATEECKWNDEKYLKPLAFEPWLMFGLYFKQAAKIYSSIITSLYSISYFDCLEVADGKFVKSEQEKIRELVEVVQQKDSLLQQAALDIENLRKSIHEMIPRQNNETERTVGKNKVSEVEDNGYFETYAHYGIHHDMLTDEVRTCSYRDAIIRNGDTFRDKLVLDLGCGTSILSMFSSNAGSKKVFSVDQLNIIYHPMDIARKNKFTNIEFVKGRLEDINLPVDKVDIIVSEWMGYFLLFRFARMLESVIYARDHHLAPNGILMPNRCKIFLLGHGDENRHRHLIQYWNNVYGFDMSCLQNEVLRETSVEIHTH